MDGVHVTQVEVEESNRALIEHNIVKARYLREVALLEEEEARLAESKSQTKEDESPSSGPTRRRRHSHSSPTSHSSPASGSAHTPPSPRRPHPYVRTPPPSRPTVAIRPTAFDEEVVDIADGEWPIEFIDGHRSLTHSVATRDTVTHYHVQWDGWTEQEGDDPEESWLTPTLFRSPWYIRSYWDNQPHLPLSPVLSLSPGVSSPPEMKGDEDDVEEASPVSYL